MHTPQTGVRLTWDGVESSDGTANNTASELTQGIGVANRRANGNAAGRSRHRAAKTIAMARGTRNCSATSVHTLSGGMSETLLIKRRRSH